MSSTQIGELFPAQEALTDEMVGMAATLKSSTMALEGRLRERDALLDDTDDALQRSLDSARRSRARARQIYRRCGSATNFCPLCVPSKRVQLVLPASTVQMALRHQHLPLRPCGRETVSAQEPSRLLQDVLRAARGRRHVRWDVHVHQSDVFRWLQGVEGDDVKPQACL